MNNHRFRLPKRTALLTFVGDFEGAEVRCALDVTLRIALQIDELRESGPHQEMLRLFAEAILMEWNLDDDDGQPIPPTFEGMQDLSPPFLSAMIGAWSSAMGEPSPPLAEPSNDGAMSPEESTLRLADVSKSLTS